MNCHYHPARPLPAKWLLITGRLEDMRAERQYLCQACLGEVLASRFLILPGEPLFYFDEHLFVFLG